MGSNGHESANFRARMAVWDAYNRTKADADRDLEVAMILARLRAIARLKVPEWTPEVREIFHKLHPRQPR